MYDNRYKFEWDEGKNSENVLKHGISFEDARLAFFDSNSIIMPDRAHSADEDRFFCVGKVESEIATVRFTMRGERIRIFGAGYWRRGKWVYENEERN
ncbi:MAG: BrnT family toxin [Coriobacteriia bacterium]|nr:BrnT family toxin [Coriobacteriia bacterium]